MNSPDDQLIQAAIQAGEAQIPELVKFFAHILEQDPDHFAALHARNILCLRSGNIDASAESLREVLTRLPCHHSYVEAYLQKVSEYFESSDNLVKFPTLIKTYLEKFPNEPHGHLMEVMLYYTSYDPQQLRNSLTRCYQNVKLGIHFQPSLVASIFDAAMGANWTSVTPPNLPTRIFEEISKIPIASDCAASLQEAPPPKGVSPTEELNISTSQGESVGANSAAVNGRISGATSPTKYFFQYGVSPDAMNRRTETRQVPPGRFGRVKEIGSNIFRRINSFSLSASFVETGGQPNIGGASMKLEGPFGKDRDHLDGIGIIDLVFGWESAAHLRGQVPSSFNSKTHPKPIYPGEAIDLRDAEFTVTYRADGLDVKEFHPVAWIHGGSGEALQPEVSENYSAWASTADLGSRSFNNDGAWHETTFSFECDSNSWSFCGSNIEEMDHSMERICYHPISEVLRKNVSGNICICFVCGDQLVPPEGDLE
ncbi:MAG: hypothetical protein HOF84_07650, partial [Rhodospirillales bacterium]|nr:hypothetical protein [Rhodospirillales bacterium]